MRVAFRVDSSLEIGTGHVSRCLTLASYLVELGATCHFLCRKFVGNSIELIQSKGHEVYCLEEVRTDTLTGLPVEGESQLYHSSWLALPQQEDFAECAPLLRRIDADWLVLDHYGIDHVWEAHARALCRRVMVIDDLADRKHLSDLLLDQNVGRNEVDYRWLVPADSSILVGPQFALLRKEFSEWRQRSLTRRKHGQELKSILITMGGVDAGNFTSSVLHALAHGSIRQDCQVTVVMGRACPWLKEVREAARHVPCRTEVLVDVRDMAFRMAESDLYIGAAGSTTWERCCLGLPAISVCTAENQKSVIAALKDQDLSVVISSNELRSNGAVAVAQAMESIGDRLGHYIDRSSAVTDGLGGPRVAKRMQEIT